MGHGREGAVHLVGAGMLHAIANERCNHLKLLGRRMQGSPLHGTPQCTLFGRPMASAVRLKDGRYASPLLFRDDVRLVWSNCRLYNPPGACVACRGDTALWTSSSTATCIPAQPPDVVPCNSATAGDWVRELGNRTSHQFEQQWEREGVERHWREHLAQQQAAAAAAAPAGKAPWAARGGQVSARTAAAAAVPIPYVPTPEQATGPLPAALIASPVQHNLTVHAPPAQQPAASEVAAAAAAAGVAAATSGGSSAAGPAKAGWLARADSIMQMRLADAMVALGEADDQPPSWRRALRKLRLAGMGGATLEVGKGRWAGWWYAGGAHVALSWCSLQPLTM